MIIKKSCKNLNNKRFNFLKIIFFIDFFYKMKFFNLIRIFDVFYADLFITIIINPLSN